MSEEKPKATKSEKVILGIAIVAFVFLVVIASLAQKKQADDLSALSEDAAELRVLMNEIKNDTTKFSEEVTKMDHAITQAYAPYIGIGVYFNEDLIIAYAENTSAYSTPLIIERVLCGGPADRAGVQKNDEVIGYNGHDLQAAPIGLLPTTEYVAKIISEVIKDKNVRTLFLKVLRNGEEKNFSIPMKTIPRPISKWETDCK